MKELRIGIIGTGMISNRHMTVWSNIPGAKVVAGALPLPFGIRMTRLAAVSAI